MTVERCHLTWLAHGHKCDTQTRLCSPATEGSRVTSRLCFAWVLPLVSRRTTHQARARYNSVCAGVLCPPECDKPMTKSRFGCSTLSISRHALTDGMIGRNLTPPTSLEVSPVVGVIQPTTPICTDAKGGVYNRRQSFYEGFDCGQSSRCVQKHLVLLLLAGRLMPCSNTVLAECQA